MKRSLLFFALVLASYGTIQAQVTTSSVTGIVTQSSGQATPGATIRAVHTPSGTTYSSAANDAGRFNLANMRVGGPYRIEVTYVGQDPVVYENVYLQLGQPFVLNAVFEESGLKAIDEVTVSGRRNTAKTGVATTISQRQLEELPAISRSITDLTRVTPQANSSGDGFSFAGRNSLFNSLSLDGAQMNNAFGLSALPGGGTNAQPFSLDAIETIEVNLSPYDVRQGGFTGAGVNAVTKSGTNRFSGSAYSYFKNNNLQSYKVGETDIPRNETYAYQQYGVRLGGPIIKDKLFFFVNGEITRQNSPATNFRANRGEDIRENPTVTRVLASDLDLVKNTLMDRFGFDPGVYEGFENLQEANNLTARFDWNINENNKLTVRYNHLTSFRDINPSGSNARGGRGPNQNSMFFSGLRYRAHNNINSITAELNSTFNSSYANNLQVVYSSFRDYREMLSGAFPLVDIEDGAGGNYISFGSEPFSGLNRLNQDLFTVTNNFNIFAGAHTFTLGASVGYQKYGNAFAQMFNGQFRYNNVTDFISAANGGAVNPLLYQLTYSAVAGDPNPAAEFSMMPLAFYAQDDWFIKSNFKLSYGIRAELPVFTGNIPSNPLVTAMTFRDGEQLDVGRLPSTKLLVSPRVGFDWDVFQDRSFVLRGGTGIYTGGVPGVWLTNQAGNTGLMFGQENSTNPTNRPFNPDPAAYIPANPTVPTNYAINLTADGFRMPQVWRSNLTAEYILPGGVRASLDGLYTKSLNEVYHRDANLINPAGQYTGTGDTRDFFAGNNGSRINPTITNAIVLDNTSRGYAYNITAKLDKSFGRFGEAMVAYTFSDAKDITSTPGSQANSAYTGNATVNDPNTPILAYSNFVVRNRVVAAVNFNFNITKNLPTKIGVFYDGMPAGDGFGNTRYNYVVAGDIFNSGGRFSNALMYIPVDRQDVRILDRVNSGTGAILETADAQWERLNNFIEQDDYLRNRRGQYAERNGAERPWLHRFDVRIIQEISGVLKTRDDHKLQLSLDIVNLGNLLNRNWGVAQNVQMNNFMQFQRAVDGAPAYNINPNLGETTFIDNTGMISRWQMQLGIRYIFN